MSKKALTKAKIREEAELLVKQFNDAVQSGDFNAAAKLDEEIANKIGEHTAIARTECFDALKKTDNPMLYAVKQLTFPSIKTKDIKEGDEKIPVRTIEDVDRPIDLLKLHKYCDGIGADSNWVYLVEKLNLLLTCQKAQDIGANSKEPISQVIRSINDSYAMSDIARAIDLGKTPTSKTNILKTLQTVVSAMLGDGYKATSHDVSFLLSVYSKKSRKALTVTCANHRYMRQYMAEICHRIVEDKAYSVDYKHAKGK